MALLKRTSGVEGVATKMSTSSDLFRCFCLSRPLPGAGSFVQYLNVSLEEWGSGEFEGLVWTIPRPILG